MSARRGFVVAGVLAGLAVCLAELAAASQDSAVTIDNFMFTAGRVVVTVGTRVVWTNRDDIAHTVTSADAPRAFRSKPLDSGDSFSMVFTKAGTFRYFCSLHPKMQGIVVVQ